MHVFCVQRQPEPRVCCESAELCALLVGSRLLDCQRSLVERPFKSTLLLFHGHNRVLPLHASACVDLLGAGAQCTTSSALKAVTAAQQEERRRFFRCDQYVQSASVPLFAFRNRSFFSPAPWRRFALAVRGHLWTPPSIRHDNLGRIVVLLRATTVKLGMRIVEGLPLACDDQWASSALTGLRMRVDCLRLGPASTMLSSSARALGDAVGLLAGHGSGLAMLPFLPIGSRFAELDHIHNAARARNMYQYLADARPQHDESVDEWQRRALLPAADDWVHGRPRRHEYPRLRRRVHEQCDALAGRAARGAARGGHRRSAARLRHRE